MNSMYDILNKMKLLEGKQAKPDFLDLDKDGNRKESMKDAAKEVDESLEEQYEDGDELAGFPHRQSPTFGHSRTMTPGFDPTYTDVLGIGATNELEELEMLMVSSSMNGSHLARRNALLRKFGIRGPADLEKLPQIKQQMMQQIQKTQQELKRQSAEANVAARDQAERERAARQAAAQGTAAPAARPAQPGAKPAAQPYVGGIKAPVREGVDMEEGSTGDYSAKKARAGKDIGKPGKTFAKIAKGAAERYGSKERGEKVAGAVLAKLRKEDVNEADMEEGNDFTKARLDAIRAGKPTFKVDGKTYRGHR